MAYVVRAYFDVSWVGDGLGPAGLSQQQANQPGIGPTGMPGVTPNAQTVRLMVGEQIAGADAPTAAQIQAALAQAGTDAGSSTILTTAIIAAIQGWAPPNPGV